MKRKAIISLTLILVAMISLSGCGKKQKTTVLTNNVKQQEAMKENEVKKFIKDGTNFLNARKYEDAKSSFEKAISLDKSNKGSYLEIKDRYMEKQRIDDAYYFIKLAVSNNVDTKNMKELLNNIKSKFQVTKLYINVYQDNDYNLPEKINAKINNEDKEVAVLWENNGVDTSKVGTIKYQGKIEQYDRTCELNLRVIEIKKETKKENNTEKKHNTQGENHNWKVKKVKEEKKIGFINEIYEQNGKRYLKYDEAQFFLNKNGDESILRAEAIKDGREKDWDGGKMTHEYYIRNKDNSLKTYEISPKVDIYICGYHLNSNSGTLEKIGYEDFTTLGSVYGPAYNHPLYHIYLENNVIVKIEEQYRP
ncbi:Ig-like domain-containing protein [Clostridium sp. Marseille-Q2269]|uniref:Ig-like domain-containing protein n=1 Tax=Clostridium sp. Marseille-Q2269 TaxID=2942205 RepID=UPI002074A409|nr:Ig-like domain-containing protein [Clostridium sp. Marseille-Q2269]